MKLRKISIILFFRVLWVVLAAVVLLLLIAKNIYTARVLRYQLDFAKQNTRDYRGWYPESRASYQADSDSLAVVGQPIYLKVYLPTQFDTLAIYGSVDLASSTARLGLKQKDDSWFYKDIDQADWSANFDLSQAKIYRNQIELMISVPDFTTDQVIYLDNNWHLTFTK